MRELGRVFDRVADAYDAGRPGYPDELYGALAEASGVDLAGATAVDVGAGTGILTRALRARGSRVIAVEPGESMLARLLSRSRVGGGVAALRADGNALPLADGVADLVTYAQSWQRVELERVARSGALSVPMRVYLAVGR